MTAYVLHLDNSNDGVFKKFAFISCECDKFCICTCTSKSYASLFPTNVTSEGEHNEDFLYFFVLLSGSLMFKPFTFKI